MITTFSANSLKLLDKSYELFKKRYIDKTELFQQNEEAMTGNNFHLLICYYLKGFEIEKFENALDINEKELWEKVKTSDIMEFAHQSKEKFIEQPFYVSLKSTPYYLTGRFDAVIKDGEKYRILDWKQNAIPKNPKNDIQTVVYFYAASKLFKTENITMTYYSLEKGETADILYHDGCDEIAKITKSLEKF